MKNRKMIASLFLIVFCLGLFGSPKKVQAESGFEYESNIKFRFVEFLKFCKITECTDNQGDDCTTPGSSMRLCLMIPIKL
ncbi:MAG: hypothetical protein ACJAVN_000843 [Roseivirga sp.]|jgi:hypothetical protein